jgi:hypothetical protein
MKYRKQCNAGVVIAIAVVSALGCKSNQDRMCDMIQQEFNDPRATPDFCAVTMDQVQRENPAKYADWEACAEVTFGPLYFWEKTTEEHRKRIDECQRRLTRMRLTRTTRKQGK